MLLSDIPAFDLNAGVAKANVVAWIKIPSSQYARLRVAKVDTGPGYAADSWIDFDPSIHTMVCAKGQPGSPGPIGPRGIRAPEARDYVQTPVTFLYTQGVAFGMFELKVPDYISKTQSFNIWFDSIMNDVTGAVNVAPDTVVSATFFEVDESVDVSTLGFKEGKLNRSLYTYDLLQTIAVQSGFAARLVVPCGLNGSKPQRGVWKIKIALAKPGNRIFIMQRGSSTTEDPNQCKAVYTTTAHFIQ